MKIFQHRAFSYGMRSLLLMLTLTAGASRVGAHGEEADPAHAVEDVIWSLQDRWNRGDMQGYLALYQRDDSLRLTFGNTIVEGWSALDALFRKSYPDPRRMGRFSIDELNVQMLGDDTAVAFGNFTHVFPTETIKGGYSHVLTQTQAGEWVIRHERTSRGEVLEAE